MSNTFRQYTKHWIKTEPKKRKETRAKKLLTALKRAYPKSKIALYYRTPMQLLAAVILSAQCTDKKVNEVTLTLFKKYKTAKDFAGARQKLFEQEIRSTGFYRNKAKNIIASAQIIEREFRGKIPKTMDDMLILPGVARKTANIVLANVYGVVEGIPVDTHVSRITQRWGITNTDNPQKIEHDLMRIYPKSAWAGMSYYIIEHGRAVCTAQNRKCNACPVKHLCPSVIKSKKRSMERQKKHNQRK